MCGSNQNFLKDPVKEEGNIGGRHWPPPLWPWDTDLAPHAAASSGTARQTRLLHRWPGSSSGQEPHAAGEGARCTRPGIYVLNFVLLLTAVQAWVSTEKLLEAWFTPLWNSCGVVVVLSSVSLSTYSLLRQPLLASVFSPIRWAWQPHPSSCEDRGHKKLSKPPEAGPAAIAALTPTSAPPSPACWHLITEPWKMASQEAPGDLGSSLSPALILELLPVPWPWGHPGGGRSWPRGLY